MKAKAKSLRFLGEGKKLKVPFFQRRYVWKKENWNELLQAFLNTDTKPFLGSLIIKHISQSEDYIIDGQQRLTTVTILAKAIYDSLLADNKQGGIRSGIESFLFYKDNSADDFKDSYVKIEHSRLDCNDYNTIIKAGLLNENADVNLDNIDETSSKICQCYKYYREKLQNFTTEQLKQLFNSLFNEDRRVFVLIELEHDDVNEQSIFDTINRAGIPLNAADIIKNNLFKRLIDLSTSKDDEEVIRIYTENWDTVFNSDPSIQALWDEKRTFGNVQHTNLEFLLYCVACIKWGEDRDMFPNLAEVFEKQTDRIQKYELIGLIVDIKKYADLFKTFILDLKVKSENPEDEVFFKYDNYIYRLLFILQKFKFQMFYPYVLKRLFESEGNYDDEILKHDFHVLESFIMRRKISSRGTHDYTSKCYDIINNGVEKLFENNETDITDSSVCRALSNTKDDAATMILFWIELFLRKQKNYDVNALEYTFTLEHIMPKSWEKNWSQIKIMDNGIELSVDSEEGKTYRNDHIQSIGNKTLLTSRINASVKNSCFKDKILGNGNNQSYQNHTSLILTKSIVDNYTDGSIWDEKQIEIRQNKLFDLFKKVWPNFKKDTSNEEHEVMTKQTQSAENTDIEKTIDDYESDVFDDANKLLEALTISQQNKTDQTNNANYISLKDRFIDEIKNGKIYYSYKPVFIKAIFDNADENGTAYIYDIAMYFIKFYNDRKENGLTVENPESVVCKGDFSIDEALKTIKQYPLDIYQKTNTVKYNSKDLTVSIVKEVWELLTADEKKDILSICDKRIESYYSKLI